MSLTLEKKILIEVIRLYKNLPCLWNPSHSHYTNKYARERGYSTLLEKYKVFDSMADKTRLKKKIENMRTTYRRERRKVIKSQLSDEGVYEPMLWYFHEMKFLEELVDGTSTVLETSNDECDGERSISPPAKRPKTSCVYLTEDENRYIESTNKEPVKKVKKSSVYLADNDNDEDADSDDQEDCTYNIKNEPTELSVGTSSTTATDLFARAIAAQLSGLQPKQKFIAEKLISDVVFFGRLDKLTTGSELQLNADCY